VVPPTVALSFPTLLPRPLRDRRHVDHARYASARIRWYAAGCVCARENRTLLVCSSRSTPLDAKLFSLPSLRPPPAATAQGPNRTSSARWKAWRSWATCSGTLPSLSPGAAAGLRVARAKARTPLSRSSF